MDDPKPKVPLALAHSPPRHKRTESAGCRCTYEPPPRPRTKVASRDSRSTAAPSNRLAVSEDPFSAPLGS
jgi:hypothetical protein